MVGGKKVSCCCCGSPYARAASERATKSFIASDGGGARESVARLVLRLISASDFCTSVFDSRLRTCVLFCRATYPADSPTPHSLNSALSLASSTPPSSSPKPAPSYLIRNSRLATAFVVLFPLFLLLSPLFSSPSSPRAGVQPLTMPFSGVKPLVVEAPGKHTATIIFSQ